MGGPTPRESVEFNENVFDFIWHAPQAPMSVQSVAPGTGPVAEERTEKPKLSKVEYDKYKARFGNAVARDCQQTVEVNGDVSNDEYKEIVAQEMIHQAPVLTLH